MEWIPVLATPALTAAAIWLSKSVIAERLKNSVKHEFDEKLERLRMQLREAEAHAQAVRTTALGLLSQSQSALVQRRLKAAEDLWRATMVYKSGSALVQAVSRLRIGEIEKHRNDPKVQQLLDFVESLGLGAGFLDRLKENGDVSSCRPFVTPAAWMLYEAYSSIIFVTFAKVRALRLQLDATALVRTRETVELVKTALPEFASLLEEHAEGAFAVLLPDLEEKLLMELRGSAEGRDADAEGVERAKKVARMVFAQQADQLKQDVDTESVPAIPPRSGEH